MKDNSRERFPESVAISGRRRETARQEFAVRARGSSTCCAKKGR